MIYLRAGCAPYRWKGLNEGYNFAFGLKFGSLKTKYIDFSFYMVLERRLLLILSFSYQVEMQSIFYEL